MIKKALIAAAALVALSAHAGYAQLQTPAGFGGTSGNWTYAAAANDKVYGKVVHQAGALTANVGGQAVKMPAAYRLAANAPRIAAAAIYLHPGIRTAVGIASWLFAAKVIWDAANSRWVAIEEQEYQPSTGFIYTIYRDPPGVSVTGTNFQDTCTKAGNAVAAAFKQTLVSIRDMSAGSCFIYTRSADGSGDQWGLDVKKTDCPIGWFVTPAGCVQTKPLVQPLSEPEFIEKVAPKPMPDTVPLELPFPAPLPVERPYINPEPGENPANRPLRVPTGEPQPIPNTNPQQWRQPYVDIVPAPTPDKPWQVDVKPGETTSTNPNPVENPQPDSQDKPAEEQDKSLCEKHPEIAACEKVEVTDKPLPDQPKLYEPKYPDGITGVWNSKLQEIKATPLFNLAPSLLPNVSAGSCPSWKIDLSIDGWTNAGLQDVSPPCWVWDVAKLVIIASALLLARRLIFGG